MFVTTGGAALKLTNFPQHKKSQFFNDNNNNNNRNGANIALFFKSTRRTFVNTTFSARFHSSQPIYQKLENNILKNTNFFRCNHPFYRPKFRFFHTTTKTSGFLDNLYENFRVKPKNEELENKIKEELGDDCRIIYVSKRGLELVEEIKDATEKKDIEGALKAYNEYFSIEQNFSFELLHGFTSLLVIAQEYEAAMNLIRNIHTNANYQYFNELDKIELVKLQFQLLMIFEEFKDAYELIHKLHIIAPQDPKIIIELGNYHMVYAERILQENNINLQLHLKKNVSKASKPKGSGLEFNEDDGRNYLNNILDDLKKSSEVEKKFIEEAIANYNQSLLCFLQCSSIEPDNHMAHIKAGMVFGKIDLIDKAMMEFDIAINLAPENPIGYQQKYATLMDSGEFQRALDTVEEYLKVKSPPEFPIFYFYKSVCYYYLKDYISSVQFGELAESSGENTWNTSLFLAKSHFKLKDYKKAVECYHKVLSEEFEPHNESAKQDVYYGLGLCYQFLGNYTSSIEYLNKAIDVDPLNNANNHKYYFHKAKALSLMKKYNDALIAITKAEGHSIRADYILEKGIILALLNRHDDAIACFDIASKELPMRSYAEKIKSLNALGKTAESRTCEEYVQVILSKYREQSTPLPNSNKKKKDRPN